MCTKTKRSWQPNFNDNTFRLLCSVCPHASTQFPLDGFKENSILGIFIKNLFENSRFVLFEASAVVTICSCNFGLLPNYVFLRFLTKISGPYMGPICTLKMGRIYGPETLVTNRRKVTLGNNPKIATLTPYLVKTGLKYRTVYVKV
jgi:hypothetical protein